MTSPGGKEVGRISIRVVPDTSRFRADLQRQLDVIEKGVRGKVHVDLVLDSNGIREKVQAATKGLDKSAKVNMDLDSVAFWAKFEAIRARLAKDLELEVKVNVDRSKLDRVGNSIGGVLGKVGDKFSSIFSGGGGGGAAASGLGGMGRTLAIVAAVASLAAPALALISGILVTLPAVISAVLIPIGAIALGLDGIKKAAEVLKGPLDGLKATMSQAFQDKLTPVFTKLRDIFPTLNQEMPKIAAGLSDMASSFVNTITSEKGMESIRGTISNIGKALTDAAPGVGSFTDGLLSLAERVSAKFPGLSKWFNESGDAFQKWVTKITTPSWFDGKTPLDTAMTSLKDTVKELMSLGGDLLSKGFDFLSDPKFGEKMKQFVADCRTLVNDILPQLKQFFMDIGDSVKTTTDLLHQFADFKPPTWTPGGKDPNAQPEGDPLGPNSQIGQVFSGQAWEETKTSWQQTTTLVGAMFDRLWLDIKTKGAAAFLSVATTAGGVWGTVVSAAQTAWAGVAAIVQGALAGIGGTLASVPGILSSAWSSLSSVASTAWQGVVTAVQTALANAVAAVVSGAAQMVAEVVALGGKVVSACSNFGSLLVGAGAALIQGLINGIGSLAQSAIDKAVGIATSVANAVKGALGIHSPSTVFTEIGANTMLGLQDGLEGGFQGVLERAKALAQEITDAINGGLEGVDGKTLTDKLKQQMAEIGLESDALKNDLNATTDKGQKDGIRDQRTQLQTIRDQLKEQSDQLGFSQKYGEQLDTNKNLMGDSLNKMVDAGKGFAEANVKQFMGDIGMSGNGAVPQVADQLLGWGSQLLSGLISGGGQTNIHVNSIDEGLAAKQTLQNKKSLQYAQRG